MNTELGKTIRDSIHGDIFIENKYMKIVNTKEFQRLRRINQLSVGNFIFPSAQHTRFSHSIGTFHLMKKIIDHIEGQLNNINIRIEKKDKELALLIALIHDIGHGPFSHAFEGVLLINHEEWTKNIILGDTDLNKEIVNNFGENYPNELVKLLDKRDCKNNNRGELNLFFVIKSLISSQLDADRLDYLVRDSKNTGVTLGKIDLSRIIYSIRITEFDDNIYVCIPEKNILDIKNYLLARDNMHESVYYHPIKCELENIIKLIFKRCSELVVLDNKFLYKIPDYLRTLISENKIDLDNYIYLDDYVIISFFKSLLEYKDFILNKLVSAIIYREKFTHLQILDSEENSIKQFKNKLNNIVEKNLSKNFKVVNDEYYWMEAKVEHTPYKSNKEQVYVLANSGLIKPLESMLNDIEKKRCKIFTFINLEIIMDMIDNHKKDTVKINLEKLIDIYNSRNHIEIERKFLLDNVGFYEIESAIKQYSDTINISEKNTITQIDIYYDTDDNYFYKNNITCRVRQKKDKFYATIKTPANDISGNERFEYEFEVDDYEITSIAKVMQEYVGGDIHEKIHISKKVLEVYNNRIITEVEENGVKYEFAYDSISYKNMLGKEFHKESELEIELKSNYYHRVHLKKISDYLTSRICKLIINNESKYKRGMKLMLK
ncbi:CYTH domain-containing protein [Clostridium chrysemydis]|uniref:CYTH domain-containing protein n=1 Tax=Clostridium chrysemydis TaxID=2665504 RepID=UPI003F3FB1A6